MQSVKHKAQIHRLKLKTFRFTTLWLCIFSFAFYTLFGCGKKPKIELPPEDEFAIAKELFNNKKYNKAIERFQNLISKHPTSKYVEEAQYYLAKSYFLKKDYEKAEQEYSFFIRTYPRARFLRLAEFDYCLCLFHQTPHSQLDQSSTLHALQEIQAFIKKYPDDSLALLAKEYERKCIDKLVEKELASAKLYIKMGKYKSALIHLNYIKENFAENSFSDEVKKLIDLCQRK